MRRQPRAWQLSIARRNTLAGLAWLAISGLAPAQPARIYRVGWLGNLRPQSPQALAIWDAFRLELQRRGWSEGSEVMFERRYAEGVIEQFPRLARELVELNVDLIVAVGTDAAAAAKQATGQIPIVFASVGDPVGQRLVASLARPGGNLTGLTTQGGELSGKRLALLKEAFPHIVRVAALNAEDSADGEVLHRAAATLGLRLLSTNTPRATDLADAISAQQQTDAWFVGDSTFNFANHKTIVELIAAQRKPVIYPHVIYAHAGGLMAYAVELKDQFRRAAVIVDRILRGAKPAELPVEQPATFDFVLNLKTAKALGLTISQSIIVRANELIQ